MTGQLLPQAHKELVEESVDILTVLDESKVVQYESPAIERILGYDPEEFVGENPFEYIHPEDRQRALDVFDEIVESPGGYTTDNVEFRFRHNDGSWIWFESRMSNRRASAIGRYVVSSRDITDRKAYEQQLRRERDRLERFVGFVSHDLRNPLCVAEGRLALGREECESEHLDAVARALDRMDELIEDVLTVVREGETELLLDAVDLRETAEACWHSVETKAATLTIETDRSIVADERRFQQLFENLIRNAVEHGGEDVTITVGGLTDGFYIEDDGRGIPDEDRGSILEYGVSTKSGGTGLGLSIVHQVVESHGWNLTITERDGGGARFEITGVEAVE